MKASFFKLTFFFLVIPLFSYSQIKLTPAEKFFDFLNNYQKDSLDNLLTEDFKLLRTYSDFRNNKTTFLDDYISYSKAYNGKYEIVRVISNTEPQQFLVVDRSDYFKYLKIENPKWIISVFSDKNKVKQVNIDSTNSYSRYLKDMRVKNSDFDNWLEQKHPELTLDAIIKADGLLIKLLKEYYEENK